MFKLLTFAILTTLAALAAAQYPGYPSPYVTYPPSYSWTRPTFSSLNTYNTQYPYYYYTTPYPYTTNNNNNNNNNNAKIRIWPYVIGQYLYPSYYNSNSNNPYASYSTTNPSWLNGYTNAYQMPYQNNYGKK